MYKTYRKQQYILFNR